MQSGGTHAPTRGVKCAAGFECHKQSAVMPFSIARLQLLTALLIALSLSVSYAKWPWNQDGDSPPSLAPMLESVVPAVVNISTAHEEVIRASPLFQDPFFRHFFRDFPQQRSHTRVRRGLGTGVILDAERGYVVTNHHLIERASDISVTLHDGRELKAELIGSDDETDVAILRIDDDNLNSLPIADSEALRVGDFVVAIGNPFGLGQTVTSGIVSALGRSGVFRTRGYENFIQTDASINPGNSGGALVSLRGELIGINTAILSRSGGNIGIGFAIPVAMVLQVAEQLIEYGEVQRGQLGVQAQALTPELAAAFDVPPSEGVVITEVIRGSPAAAAGIRTGDILRRIDDQEIRNVQDMRRILGLLRIGREVEIELARGQEILTVSAATTNLRISGDVLHPAMRGMVLTDQRDGNMAYVVITEVAGNSPAAQKGIRAGDRLRSINRFAIRSIQDARASTQRSEYQILLQVQRGNRSRFILLP